ncbi:hypothetical protein, partial [Psychrobacter sp. CMS30]|uniref:hypothetical protein n=1 Tax=Psychrobacter sp. CMS30 TaxID=2774126 RepID=UPI001D10B089
GLINFDNVLSLILVSNSKHSYQQSKSSLSYFLFINTFYLLAPLQTLPFIAYSVHIATNPVH